VSEDNPTFTSGPEFQMRENAKRLDAQAEILSSMAFSVLRAADNQISQRLAGEYDAARLAVHAAAAALRNAASVTERFGEWVEHSRQGEKSAEP
jgi:hypothetical protein